MTRSHIRVLAFVFGLFSTAAGLAACGSAGDTTDTTAPDDTTAAETTAPDDTTAPETTASDDTTAPETTGPDDTTQELVPVELALAWFPSPEYGGVYAALTQGYFEDEGLDVTVTPGGPGVSIVQVIGSGQADLGMIANDTQLMLAATEDIPVSLVSTTYQEYPSGILFHKANPLTTLADMHDRDVYGTIDDPDAKWLEYKYDTVRNNTYIPWSIPNFAADDEAVIQAYITNNVPILTDMGVDVGYLPISESDINPYNGPVFGMHDYIESNQETVTAVARALANGLVYYRNNYEEINDHIHTLEGTAEPEVNNTIAQAQDAFIYLDGEGEPTPIGVMEEDRVRDDYEKYVEAGIIEPFDFEPFVEFLHLAPTDIMPPELEEEPTYVLPPPGS
jgi:NitT/TauT family transport system substrate-binding protein